MEEATQSKLEYNPPLITVLTLSYFSPDLYAAIDSVLAQNYSRIQYILVDDCTDGFSETNVSTYITERKNSNLEESIIIRNPENLGTVRAANIGLKRARGEYVFMLAGDDVYANAQVLSSWTAAFENSGALAMTAYHDAYDERMIRFLERLPTAKQVRKIERMTPENLFHEVAKANFIYGCSTAYSRQCIEQYSYYDESYKLIEDYPMILRLLRQGVRVVFYNEVVVYYRSSGVSSASKRNDAFERDVDKIFENEVRPHVKKPAYMWKQRQKWRKQRRMTIELQQKLRQPGISKSTAFRHKLWFYLNFPGYAIRRFKASPSNLKKLFSDE